MWSCGCLLRKCGGPVVGSAVEEVRRAQPPGSVAGRGFAVGGLHVLGSECLGAARQQSDVGTDQNKGGTGVEVGAGGGGGEGVHAGGLAGRFGGGEAVLDGGPHL